ncbi:hypothetical protein TUN199_11170 [Pyrenophora tritici-repentis]|nr:hypothetical protein Alg130_11196 [Pyrenophora tritici-repentis]KAI0605573.1 hypothetical protein TUN205_10184 [Pyrenophora tritici-repentis]KAI0616836.1 hypothetical protein TUN199_11170 [Pyrenophora tritici-repentis]
MSIPVSYMPYPQALLTQTVPAPTTAAYLQSTFTPTDPSMTTAGLASMHTVTTVPTDGGTVTATITIQTNLLVVAIITMVGPGWEWASNGITMKETSPISTFATSSSYNPATLPLSKIATSSFSTLLTSTLSMAGISSHSPTATLSSVTKSTVETSLHTSTETPQAKPQSDISSNWIHRAGMYGGIIVGAIFALIIILLAVLALRRRATRKKELESLRPIRLQPLRQSGLRRSDNPVWPLAPPAPRQTFGETIRAYAADSRDTSTTFRPVRTLSQTEAMIRDRIATTGRPDLPLSATPRIYR